MKLRFEPPNQPTMFDVYLGPELVAQIWFGFLSQQWELIKLYHPLTKDQMLEIVEFIRYLN